ncbi:MAG: DUF1284 domain-containing protein [Janthinobacterium lividum]
MPVKLRPHHLLCVLTYVGKGYSPAFVAQYDRVAARLSAGEALLVVDGPDDICATIVDTVGSHCRGTSASTRDRLAAERVGALLGRSVASGAVLELGREQLGALRHAFANGQLRSACVGCEWERLCDSIAERGFTGVRITRE